MVMPTPLVEQLYELLLSTEQVILDNLKPGTPICEAYRAGLDHFKGKKPDYAQYLVKSNFGYLFALKLAFLF
jgi:hypothetical protein